MTPRPHEPSLARLARLTGALLIGMAISALFADLGGRASLVVPGDAHATATRILASQPLFRLAFVGYLVAFLLDVPVAVLFHVLLRPVNETRALMATAFRLVYTAAVAACLLFFFGALLLLNGGASQSAFEPKQLEALASLCLDLFSHGFSLALAFFGVHLVLLGTLLLESRQLPKGLAVLVVLGGLAHLVDSASLFLAPSFHEEVAPWLGMLAMSELALAIWLLVRGWGAHLPAEPIGESPVLLG